MECLTLKGLRYRAPMGGAFFTGEPGRYVKNGFGYGNLHRVHFTAKENLAYRGRFIYWGL